MKKKCKFGSAAQDQIACPVYAVGFKKAPLAGDFIIEWQGEVIAEIKVEEISYSPASRAGYYIKALVGSMINTRTGLSYFKFLGQGLSLFILVKRNRYWAEPLYVENLADVRKVMNMYDLRNERFVELILMNAEGCREFIETIEIKDTYSIDVFMKNCYANGKLKRGIIIIPRVEQSELGSTISSWLPALLGELSK